MSQDISIQETHHSENTGTMQLVSFRLANEEYGVEITKVQEIILMGEITQRRRRRTISGTDQLRSTVIPIVDLRLRFGLAQEETSDETRIMGQRGRQDDRHYCRRRERSLRISPRQFPAAPDRGGTGPGVSHGLVKLTIAC